MQNITLPSPDDFEGAIRAIHRLEDTYLLDTREIRFGNLSANYSSRFLTGSNFVDFFFYSKIELSSSSKKRILIRFGAHVLFRSDGML